MQNRDDGVEMEPFSVLAHEIRLQIIGAFFDRWDSMDPTALDDARDERGLRYSTLMDAVGMQDSGKFNYHLDQLRGIYVEQVGERYVPTASAIALYHAVLAHRPTEDHPNEPFDVDASCPACGEPVAAQYDQEYLSIDCPDCEDWWGLHYPFPKNGLDGRSGADLLAALDDRAMYDIGLARTGQCPSCAGHVSIDLDGLDGEQIPVAGFSCGSCFWTATIDVVNALRFEPRVGAVLVDFGIAPGDNGEREVDDTNDFDVTGERSDAASELIELTFSSEQETAAIVVDDDLSVQSVERSGQQ